MRTLLFFIIASSISFTQKLEPIDIAIQELENLVHAASRNSQKVFVEDFTGLQ